MFQITAGRLHLELTPQQVEWLKFACDHARDAAADSGDDQLHAGIVTLGAAFSLASAAAEREWQPPIPHMAMQRVAA